MLLKRASWVGVAVSLALVAGVSRATAPETATASTTFVAATLSLRGTQRLISPLVTCPPEAPPDAIECRDRTGSGSIPGLGSVSAIYLWSFGAGSPPCPGFHEASRDDREACRRRERRTPLRTRTGEPSASGPSTKRAAGLHDHRRHGYLPRGIGERQGRRACNRRGHWGGDVDGDARRPRTRVRRDVTHTERRNIEDRACSQRRKRVRVTYNVTASDGADGQVPVTCDPRSGSRFPIGRTIVRCSATDSSGNTANASFRIIVRATRPRG